MVCDPRDKVEIERRYLQALKPAQPAVQPCTHCAGTGSRLLVVVDGQSFYFPNTKDGWKLALAKLGESP